MLCCCRAAAGIKQEAPGSRAAGAGGKPSMRYLQRYYHKGAFFQDDEHRDDALFSRDFMEATGEDATVDRALLPEVMQVKKWGLKGRTRYTHLADQDTTLGDLARQQHGARAKKARDAGTVSTLTGLDALGAAGTGMTRDQALRASNPWSVRGRQGRQGRGQRAEGKRRREASRE